MPASSPAQKGQDPIGPIGARVAPCQSQRITDIVRAHSSRGPVTVESELACARSRSLRLGRVVPLSLPATPCRLSTAGTLRARTRYDDFVDGPSPERREEIDYTFGLLNRLGSNDPPPSDPVQLRGRRGSSASCAAAMGPELYRIL